MLAFAPNSAGDKALQAPPRVAPAIPKVSAPGAPSLNAPKLVATESTATYQAASDSPANLDWNTLLTQINVQGMARELAKNSV
jgi:hypothetical protein